MPNFATEAGVREKFQLTDTTLIPADWVTNAIDDAHTELLLALDPVHDTGSPPDALVLGETLLAGAHLLRSIASKHAFDQKRVSVGGNRIEEGRRFDALTVMADAAESRAWDILEPYLVPRPPRAVLVPSGSTPIFGED
jgi:hypothetical protein